VFLAGTIYFMNTVTLSVSSKVKRLIYFGALTISVFTLICILVNPMARNTFISPLIATFDTLTHSTNAQGEGEKFAFIPGWSSGKFDLITLNNIKTLAFYDLAFAADGTFETTTAGYENFKSVEAQALFERAHTNNVKVLAVLSMTSTPDIERFLNDTQAQDTLINGAIADVQESGIDGVVIDIEYTGKNGNTLQASYSNFVQTMRDRMHQARFGSQVTVAVSPTLTTSAMYDVKTLTDASDKVFVMSYENAVAEITDTGKKAPIYGYQETEYWKDLENAQTALVSSIPADKVMTETAWYGNGENYPFYQKKVSKTSKSEPARVGNTLKTPLSSRTTERLLLEVPRSSRASAREYLPLIAKALEDEGILTPRVLAYAMATIEHETASTFEPLEEYKGRKSARRLGYEGGTNYFGRGFIQLTHLRNYKKIGERIGMGDELVRHPELAATPDVAAKVLAAFFKDNGPAVLAAQGNFVAARRPINPDYQGYSIALLAQKYLYMIA
jgi:predicted chitinase